jgi:flagellar protein FlgJ
MFNTVRNANGLLGGGAGEEAWRPMLVQEFAKQIAAHGGLGLAKPVYDSMIRMQEAGKK